MDIRQVEWVKVTGVSGRLETLSQDKQGERTKPGRWDKNIPLFGPCRLAWREIFGPAPLSEVADYDQYWLRREKEGRFSPALPRYEVAAQLIPDGASLLDVGCGSGDFLAYLKQSHPNCDVLGVDVSPQAVAIARSHGVPAEVIRTNLPLGRQLNRRYDYIVLMEVLEHLVDAESLVRDLITMQPKRIIVTVPNMGFFMHRLRLLVGRMPVTSVFFHMREHVRFWTVTDFHQWVDILGLRVIKTLAQNHKRWLARIWPSLMARAVMYELETRNSSTVTTQD